jgi:protein unc-119
VGEHEVPSFRMVERHYFRDTLVKSFDFNFGFCIPGSTNTWDAVYAVPPLDEALMLDMINHPYETRSDRSVVMWQYSAKLTCAVRSE